MLAPSQASPPVDQWLALPPPPDYRHEAAMRKRALQTARRLARSILFDKGHGHLKNLSIDDQAIVRAEITSSYERYKFKAKVEDRTPIGWREFVFLWKKFGKSVYRQHDIPRRLREHFGD